MIHARKDLDRQTDGKKDQYIDGYVKRQVQVQRPREIRQMIRVGKLDSTSSVMIR